MLLGLWLQMYIWLAVFMFQMDYWNFPFSKKKNNKPSIFWQNWTYFICITELPICEGSNINLKIILYYFKIKTVFLWRHSLNFVKNICMFDENSWMFWRIRFNKTSGSSIDVCVRSTEWSVVCQERYQKYVFLSLPCTKPR